MRIRSKSQGFQPCLDAAKIAAPFNSALGIARMKTIAALLTVVSLVISAVFCLIGVIYLKGAEGNMGVLIAAIFTLSYGISNAVILGVAWLKPLPGLRPISRWAAFSVAILWVVGSLDLGRISGLEVASILGVTLLLLFNILSVSRVLAISAAQQRTSADAPKAARP